VIVIERCDSVRELLRRHGDSALAYMATWRGNRHWFSPDSDVVIAYQIVGSVALTVGDPVGPAAEVPAGVRDFTRFCRANGWTPCLYGVGAELSGTLAAGGWRRVQVAEETRLPLAELSFTGRKWQDVRTALNKARRAGIEARWQRYRDLPPDLAAQVRDVFREWLAGKDMPEMRFTLGGLDELVDDEVRCLIAVDADRRVHAVTSWLPVYRDGEITGWTLDVMRRRLTSGNGIMEFLIASAALRFKAEGAEFASLSAAPLARLAGNPPRTGLERLLDRVGRTLEPVYGFRSLLAFKLKFQPVCRPLYLMYPDPAALPAIGFAVTRAYLPELSLRQGLRLFGRALRGARPAAASVSRPAAASGPDRRSDRRSGRSADPAGRPGDLASAPC
jgi:phosphatidylglycerol lysyltransferase